ncbi:ras-like GTP-binding protein RHO [Exaiptasia diaphana]|uniref:Uncharacterized protein n=1 Tax=Exaiptasia diaphana TaxID=2652724 RepID=A0A913X9K8_EXADI|nr:ras-like GTP-binding protein RHO [Exaiptasia diaphana]KXJ26763.1 Transforming protein RhoA [Exaiptasia diaphana]
MCICTRNANRLKFLFLGDHGVGKTCTTIAAIVGSYPSSYIPSADFENWAHYATVDGVDYFLDVAEAPGRDCKEDIRVLAFVGIEPDVLFICFDVANRASFESVEQKWLPEVKHLAPYLPIVLVANKTDLWNSSDRNSGDIVSAEEGRSLVQRLGLDTYLECSAMTHDGIPDVIPTGVRVYKDSKAIIKRCRKVVHRLKVVFSNKPTLSRFLKCLITCKYSYFVYCSRHSCVLHMRSPPEKDYPNCYCRQKK